jgi:hypothetical protein
VPTDSLCSDVGMWTAEMTTGLRRVSRNVESVAKVCERMQFFVRDSRDVKSIFRPETVKLN